MLIFVILYAIVWIGPFLPWVKIGTENDFIPLTLITNSELLMCRKIWCNRNVRNRVHKTEFGRIVL